MLEEVKFLKDHRCFKEGDSFKFRDVTVLVGDQGCGKSTLLYSLGKFDKTVVKVKTTDDKLIETTFLDFEKDNPRQGVGARRLMDKNAMASVAVFFSSHGETVKALLKSITDEFKDKCIFMDEPDMALSIRSCHLLVDFIKQAVKNGNQVVLSAHNSIVIAAFDEVLSLEHRKWMKSSEFIESHSVKDA